MGVSYLADVETLRAMVGSERCTLATLSLAVLESFESLLMGKICSLLESIEPLSVVALIRLCGVCSFL